MSTKFWKLVVQITTLWFLKLALKTNFVNGTSANATLNSVHLLTLLLHAKADAHQLNNKVPVVQNEFVDHVTSVLMRTDLSL
jgi:hypothetical protein